MSARTLIEINHDYGHRIDDHPDRFLEALGAYIRSGSCDDAEGLERFGVRVFGVRHHADSFGPTTLARLMKHEWSERPADRNERAAAEALVRGILVDLFGQQMTNEQIWDVADKVRRAIKRSVPKLDVTQNAVRVVREATEHPGLPEVAGRGASK